MVGHVIEMH